MALKSLSSGEGLFPKKIDIFHSIAIMLELIVVYSPFFP
jgi:hypothetical protein